MLGEFSLLTFLLEVPSKLEARVPEGSVRAGQERKWGSVTVALWPPIFVLESSPTLKLRYREGDPRM